nr:Trm112 family protein [Salinibius halmophilus]
MDPQLLAILVCPVTKTSLQLSDDGNELIATGSRKAYPIRDSIPVMLPEEARELSDDEYDTYIKRKS